MIDFINYPVGAKTYLWQQCGPRPTNQHSEQHLPCREGAKWATFPLLGNYWQNTLQYRLCWESDMPSQILAIPICSASSTCRTLTHAHALGTTNFTATSLQVNYCNTTRLVPVIINHFPKFQGKTLHTHTKYYGRLNTLTLGDWAGRRARARVGSVGLTSLATWVHQKSCGATNFIYNSIIFIHVLTRTRDRTYFGIKWI